MTERPRRTVSVKVLTGETGVSRGLGATTGDQGVRSRRGRETPSSTTEAVGVGGGTQEVVLAQEDTQSREGSAPDRKEPSRRSSSEGVEGRDVGCLRGHKWWEGRTTETKWVLRGMGQGSSNGGSGSLKGFGETVAESISVRLETTGVTYETTERERTGGGNR